MDNDQELLDRFAIAAMAKFDESIMRTTNQAMLDRDCEHIWRIAMSMKQARDRICTTAKPAEMDPGPFPKIDMEGTKC